MKCVIFMKIYGAIISDEPTKECVLIFSSLLNNFKNG